MVALQADDAYEHMLSMQNEVVQINSASATLAHERQRRIEIFVEEFTTQIAVALRALKDLQEAYMAVIEDPPTPPPPCTYRA